MEMEKHQQHGVIVTDIERPDPQVVAGFARHDVAKIGDAWPVMAWWTPGSDRWPLGCGCSAPRSRC
jgi:hypothetical protein